MTKTFLVEGYKDEFEKRLNKKINEIENDEYLDLKITDIKFSSNVDRNSYSERIRYSALIITIAEKK